jgi:hypothetical protein
MIDRSIRSTAGTPRRLRLFTRPFLRETSSFYHNPRGAAQVAVSGIPATERHQCSGHLARKRDAVKASERGQQVMGRRIAADRAPPASHR